MKASLRTVFGRSLFTFFLLLLLGGAMLFSLRVGALKLSFPEILSILWNRPEGIAWQILYNVRLPRILLGAVTGASFAVAGAILQGVMRNPLASPGVIGVSSGGGLAGILVMLVFPRFGVLLIPAAFCGALATAAAVYLLAWKRGASPVRLILAGVAVSAMLGAFSSAILLFNAEKAGGVLDFTVGSLSARSWDSLRQTGFYMAAGFLGSLLLAGRLNILALGDEVAAGLGMNVERVRFLLIAAAALLAAAAVSAVGLLGFVGLIAPHMVRMAIGADHRFLIPASGLSGAFLVVTCDAVGRIAGGNSEIPVGVIMALLGPPFFLWLLRRVSYEA